MRVTRKCRPGRTVTPSRTIARRRVRAKRTTATSASSASAARLVRLRRLEGVCATPITPGGGESESDSSTSSTSLHFERHASWSARGRARAQRRRPPLRSTSHLSTSTRWTRRTTLYVCGLTANERRRWLSNGSGSASLRAARARLESLAGDRSARPLWLSTRACTVADDARTSCGSIATI